MTPTPTATRPIPLDPFTEPARLDALYQMAILDTPPEARLQALVSLVAKQLRMPSAALTFVDRDRLWIKASVGVGMVEMLRADAFCAHTVYKTGVMVVPDALADPRFAGGPLVRGEPHIRFYAGAPVRSATGLALGALCVLDFVPRQLSEPEQRELARLADIVASELIVRQSVARLSEDQGLPSKPVR